jgi:hypothetical protein
MGIFSSRIMELFSMHEKELKFIGKKQANKK